MFYYGDDANALATDKSMERQNGVLDTKAMESGGNQFKPGTEILKIRFETLCKWSKN